MAKKQLMYIIDNPLYKTEYHSMTISPDCNQAAKIETKYTLASINSLPDHYSKIDLMLSDVTT